MKIKRAGFLALSVVCLLGVASPVGATLLSVTDSTLLGAGSPITYTLDFSATSATFTIQTPAAPGGAAWYGGWFLFKLFDGNNPADLSLVTTPAGTWTVSDGGTNSTVQVLQSGSYPSVGTLRTDGFSGFYLGNLESGQDLNYIQGINLTGGISTNIFTFDITSTGGNLNTDAVNFKVGYYDGLVWGGCGRDCTEIKNINTSQLSTDLQSVPEPGTLLLLGSGLLMAGAFVRRFRSRD